jgi:cell division transport system permease protein
MTNRIDEIKQLYSREKFLVVSNIAIMTVTFVLLSFFMSLAVGLQTAIKTLEEQAQVTLFFKDDFPEEKILQLREELLRDERVLDVTYISKEEAFQIFMDINKDEPILLEAISKDILPASLEIRSQKLASLNEFAEQFADFDGVEEVKFFKDVVERFRYWAKVVYIVGGVLVGIFFVLSLAIITATLRISISSKSDEIEILKLVGATDDYVKRPFISQGVSFGIISAIFAVLLFVVLAFGFKLLGFLSAGGLVIVPGVRTAFWVYLIITSTLLLLLGWLLGLLGSSAAVKKYLKY